MSANAQKFVINCLLMTCSGKCHVILGIKPNCLANASVTFQPWNISSWTDETNQELSLGQLPRYWRPGEECRKSRVSNLSRQVPAAWMSSGFRAAQALRQQCSTSAHRKVTNEWPRIFKCRPKGTMHWGPQPSQNSSPLIRHQEFRYSSGLATKKMRISC